MPSYRCSVLRLASTLLLLTACAPQPSPPVPPPTAAVPHDFDANGLVPDGDRLASEPKLEKRLREDVHAYFRFINVAFSGQVCAHFAGQLSSMPTVTLHGDAHLEQYAVTDAGRGLTDFDDASRGPAILDLVRFGVSLELATRVHGWEASFEGAFAEFLHGYRTGLARPDGTHPESAVAERMRASFVESREGFLGWATGLILPMSEREAAELRTAIASYAQDVSNHREDVPEGFFVVQAAGPFQLGIGSALDEKYLLRVRGQSGDPLDDVILEAKEIRSLAGVPCVAAGPKADPFRFLAGRVSVPYRPYLGTFPLNGKSFWVHAWIGNYKELELGETLQSPDELFEIAFESGVQLARAHIEGLDATPDAHLADEQIEVVRALAPEIEAAVRSMTQATLRAWQLFRKGP